MTPAFGKAPRSRRWGFVWEPLHYADGATPLASTFVTMDGPNLRAASQSDCREFRGQRLAVGQRWGRSA